ncbi:uncharacterized protein LOC143290280 [Babylonia areolata]|uniref:uncharacterized protein LOC143290280 n=1 Tax=Babylonia areolata TaxID=304850 RepID=UPI003FD18057
MANVVRNLLCPILLVMVFVTLIQRSETAEQGEVISSEKRAGFSSWAGKREYKVPSTSDTQAKHSEEQVGSGKAGNTPDTTGRKEGEESGRDRLHSEDHAATAAGSGTPSQNDESDPKDSLTTVVVSPNPPGLNADPQQALSKPGGSVFSQSPAEPSNPGGSSSHSDFEYISKRPAFNSWGGKRSRLSSPDVLFTPDVYVVEDPYLSEDVEKRASFSAWAGKRTVQQYNEYDPSTSLQTPGGTEQSQQWKRGAFSVWAGKRAPSVGNGEDYAKRGAFSVWAGKRAPSVGNGEDYAKRRGFSVWAGKRSEDLSTTDPSKRAAFSVWAGKRSTLYGPNDSSRKGPYGAQSGEANPSKRGPFSVWAGKRSDDTDSVSPSKRGPFNVWAGKRSEHPEAADAEKRGPFSVWAGKRSAEDSNPSKRGPFSVWAGKRSENVNDVSPSKRGPFSVWAGKRSVDSDSAQPSKRGPFSVWAGKRSGMNDVSLSKRGPFSVWAGKRSENVNDVSPSKRGPFSVWAGKRSVDSDSAQPSKRAPFSVWAGKRSEGEGDAGSAHGEKRASFSAWAGRRKRSSGVRSSNKTDTGRSARSAEFSTDASVPIPHDIHKRAAFNAWAGKRSAFNSWAGKRAPSSPLWRSLKLPWFLWQRKRTPFGAWAGKRSAGGDADEETYGGRLRPWSGEADVAEKREAFGAWAGKRSDDLGGGSLAEDRPYVDWLNSRGGLEVNKREAFGAWAGKRSHQGQQDESLDVSHGSLMHGMLANSLRTGDGTDDSPLTTDADSDIPEKLLLEYSLLPPSPAFLNSPDVPVLTEDLPDEQTSDTRMMMMTPSKRIWHLGFGSIGGWYQRGSGQQRALRLGQYLRRAQSPNKRRFSSWAGKRSAGGSPDLWGEEFGER